MSTTGSCLCGEVAYEYSGEPAVTALCHCTDCQKWTGGPCTSNVIVPRTSFKVSKGTFDVIFQDLSKGSPKTWDAIGDSGKVNKHFFCPNCGSSLYTQLEVMPDVTIIKAGGLNGGASSMGDKVGVEFYVKDRVTYLKGVEGAKQEPVFGS